MNAGIVNGGSMRVLITVDAVGGVWQYGLDLARGLAARGVEPVLALLGPTPDPHQLAEAREIPGVHLVETRLPLDWLCDQAAPVRAAAEAVARLAGDLDVHLVQLNMPTLAGAARFEMPVVAVTHGCVSTWWEAAKDEPLDSQYAWHRDLMRAGLIAADRLVAPTASYAAIIARHYALDETPRVVHNGRAPLPAALHTPRSQQPPSNDVLTVGRLWDRVKRADLLDRVASRLNVPFAAAGTAIGPHGETITLDHLSVLGQLDAEQLGERLSSRPIFVSAASFEPFGLAVLEAAGAGCALVLSDIPGFRELWDGAALFVGGDDEAAYVEAIESLLASPALRQDLGAAARTRAARYSPQASADAMLAIYSDLLESREGSGRAAA